MTKESIMIDCEYCIVLGNENKCKALQIETHTCLGITAKNKCPIYKIKQQLKAKEKECEELKKECAWVKESCTLNEGINYDIWYNQKLELDQLKVEKEKFKEIISQALQDFSIEIGTPQYDRLLEGVKEIGIEGVR